MCFQPAYSFIYFFLGGICCRANACHQQPYCSSAQSHTHGHTLLVSFSSWSLCLAFKYIPTLHPPQHPPTHPTIPPRHLPHPRCVSTCTSLLLSLLALLKCETARNPIFFFPPPFLFGRRGWVGWGGARGQIRNSETEAEVRSALVITNRRGLAWRDVRKNSGSGSAQKQLDATFIHTTRNFYVKTTSSCRERLKVLCVRVFNACRVTKGLY